MSRGKILAGLVILFAAGVLCGIAGTSIYHTYEREQRGERGSRPARSDHDTSHAGIGPDGRAANGH